MSRKVFPVGKELNSRRGLISNRSRDEESELDLTARSVPAGGSSDEEENIRENIQRLIQKEDQRRNMEDRSDALKLLHLRQGLTSRFASNKSNNESMDGDESPATKQLKAGNQAPFGILFPDSKFVTFWTVLVLIALIYTATVMPYLLAFYEDLSEDWLIVEMVFDIIFIFDFFMNFSVAYYEKYDLVVNRAKIIRKYVTGWMMIDLLACFPFSLISLFSSGEISDEGKLIKIAKLPRVARIIRVFRLIKVVKTAKFVKWYNETMERLNISTTLSRGIKFVGFTFCLLHLTSCAWYLIDRFDGFSPKSWVSRNKLQDKENSDLYLFSLYWGLTVLDTIGYGDITPVLTSERVLCLVWLIFGVSFYSYTISNLSVIFYNMNTKENFIKRKEEYLTEFAQNVKLDPALLKQVKSCVRFNYRNNDFCWSDMNNFLKELPSKLYIKVYNHIYRDLLRDITFFKVKPPAFISELMPLLQHVIIHIGNELYSYGSPPRDVFFLLNGRVLVKNKYDIVLFSYVKGSYFGEIELLFKSDRKSSLETEENSQMFKVDGQDFLSVIERFQEIKEEVEEVASKRYHYLKERNRNLKNAKKRLEELQKITKVNLFELNLTIKEIFEHKIDETPLPKSINEEALFEDDDYSSLAQKIEQNVKEIKEKISEVSEFFEEVMALKKE